MAGLLDVFGFLAVILRGVSLSLEALVIGGGAFFLLAQRAVSDQPGWFARRLLAGSAAAMVAIQILWLGVNSAILQSTTSLPWSDVVTADFFIAGAVEVVAAALALVVAFRLGSLISRIALASAMLLLLYGSVATSHAAARLDHQVLLLGVTAAHQLGAALWIGGLPFFLLTTSRLTDQLHRSNVAKRYTRQAVAGVGLLVAGGLILSLNYIHSWKLLYGTAYGFMVMVKIVLLGLALFLGFNNNQTIARHKLTGSFLMRLRRFTEAEIGIGFTAILAAASLTSQPPAFDMLRDRVGASVITQRFTPHVPTMQTPALADLSPATPLNATEAKTMGVSALQTYVPGAGPTHPDKPADIEWSEYNHHWAGLVVLAIGILAATSRMRWGAWAKHWPLIFIALAVFLLLRADSENWPLGPRGFWESFAIAEVAQHRLFVVLIVLFAIFEWLVQTKRVASTKAALVFPGVCALGGALLLTHNHSLSNVKEELLAEMSHGPIAIFAVVAGWCRWMEVRLREAVPRWAVVTWPICFIGIGYMLLTYREH